jgi:hypothetical protein
MRNRNSLDIDLDALEITMFRTITALTEAIVRQAAVVHRGPVISPNPESWESYIQELRGDFATNNQRLDEYLASIDWKGAPLPSNPAHWPDWWGAVRLYASRTQYSLEDFTNKPLAR